MKFTFRDIAWAALVAIIVIFLSKCHRDKYYEFEAAAKTIKDQAHTDSVNNSVTIRRLEERAQNAGDTAHVYVSKNALLNNKLTQQAATVLRLSGALRNARLYDTTVIGVDQDFLDYCDSLALESSSLALNFNQYRKNNTYILAAKDMQLSVKDSIIGVERGALMRCRNNFSAMTRLYNDSQSSTKPRRQVYVGVEIIASPQYLVNNVGLALTLKDKRNKLWQISGGLQSQGQYYARINGNILIKLK